MTERRLDIAERNAGARDESADRVASFHLRDGAVLVVADGAGNSSAGRLAAAHLLEAVSSAIHRKGFAISLAASWAQLLVDFDRAVVDQAHGGETTGVVLCVTDADVIGASVGDSEAWLLEGDVLHVLTERQERKPLLGSGRARPVTFEHHGSGGTIVIASDGLFKYAPADAVVGAMSASAGEVAAIATQLAKLPLLSSGRLHDDVGLIVCRF